MSDAAPTSRDAVIARIRASSKDAVVLEEMRRLGFWPQDQSSPAEGQVAALIEREAVLIQELHAVSRDLARLSDPEAALRQMRRERMDAALARREETRQKRAKERYERALAWQTRRGKEILHLGVGVSAGLSDENGDPERLARNGLPALDTPTAIAAAMGVPLAELRFLAYHRAVSRVSHYRRFGIAKKTGGVRLISAPMPRLKRAQYWVLDRLLARQPVHDAAYGFVAGRSIVGNALPHVGRDVVVNLDLQNFFPSIEYPRVRGLFQSLGYSRSTATILGLICTETPSEEVELDGARYHVQTGPRCLPQGAPTSPAITNLLCRRLDRRLAATAAKLGFRYTRYADDMTFSADKEASGRLARLLWRVKQIVADEGFTLHPDKQRIMRAASRQEVTGIVVNEKPSVCRDTLRRFRAVLFQVEKDGPTGKSWNGSADVIAALDGYARFIRMVDPEKGLALCLRTAALRAKHAGAPTVTGSHYRLLFREASAAGRQPPGRNWLPTEQAAPQLEKTAQQVKDEKAAAKAAVKAAAAPAPVPVPAPASRAAPAASVVTTVAPPVNLAKPPVAADEVLLEETPDSPEAREARPPGEEMSTAAYLSMAMQFVVLVVLGLLSRNPLLAIAGFALLAYSVKHRKASWFGFFVALVIARGLWMLMK